MSSIGIECFEKSQPQAEKGREMIMIKRVRVINEEFIFSLNPDIKLLVGSEKLDQQSTCDPDNSFIYRLPLVCYDLNHNKSDLSKINILRGGFFRVLCGSI
jgi:hypothetical protein